MARKSSTTSASAPATLTRRDFFGTVADMVLADAPADRPTLAQRQTMNLLKLHWGANYRVHYEAMIDSERGWLEVGLHFEDGPASTERLLRFFDRHVLEIKHRLGTEVELERWTQSWGHCYELIPVEPLTPAFARTVATRLLVFMEFLQPLLDEAYDLELVPRDPRPSTFHQRFRDRRGSRA